MSFSVLSCKSQALYLGCFNIFIFRLSHYYLRKRGCCKLTKQPEEEYLEKYKADPPYKYSNIEYNPDYASAVFTVESYRTSDSDPVYQDIREIVTDISDGGEDISDETGVIKHSDEKEYQKPIFVAKGNISNNKPSVVYGVITAKEVAKY